MMFCNSFFYKKLSEVPDVLDVSREEEAGLHGFNNIKRWTAGEHVLNMEYIFVPIHDALHWSLAFICHPAALLEEGGGALVLHLDPLRTSQHNTAQITAVLADWIRREVVSRGIMNLSRSEAAKRMHGVRVLLRVPCHVLAACEPPCVQCMACFHSTTSAKSDTWLGDLVTFDEQTSNAEGFLGRVRRVMSMQLSSLPAQENSHDCGLFLLTYLEFLVATPPSRVVSLDSGESVEAVFDGEVRYD
jgi:sentrin-specific protease 7